MKTRKIKNKGFTLVELLVATFILSVAIAGGYMVFAQIMKTTFMVSSRLTAAYLSQEGIEIIRNIRDTNWLGGQNWDKNLNTCSLGCEADYKTGTIDQATPLRAYSGAFLNIDSNNFYSYNSGTSTKFKRKITVTALNSDALRVLVLVSWEDRGNAYNSEVQEDLYNWR